MAASDRVALWLVLDDERPLSATKAGTIGAYPAVIGALLDYGAAVVTLETVP